MADLNRTPSARWLALAAALLGGLAARAAAQEKPKPVPPKGAARAADAAEARAILKDFQELSAAVRKGESAAKPADAGAALLKKLNRPERTTRKSSLDAATIDAMLEDHFAEAKVAPARLVGDEEFIRRASLDIAGKLPTPEQVVKFVQSKDRAKRAVLVDQLLASPDCAANWARYWRDVVRFRATPANPGLVRFEKLEEWLAEQFQANRPWDEIARAVLTATGTPDDTGAVVLTLAHMGQPVELAGEVSRIFLGVQIQCAQCHDHPTDPWKREQFHELAAFFAGTRARRDPAAAGGRVLKVELAGGTPRYSMPDLKDPQKSIPVEPKFFLADANAKLPKGLTAQQRRELLASYITGQDNPWFAKAFVNRVWTALVGDGFYNPVDDLGPTREAHAVEVIDTLAAEWAAGGYDVRWLFRTILNTKAYQRQFRPVDTPSGKTPFAANCPTRLRADQIVDALSQALDLNLPGGGPARKKQAAPRGGGALLLNLFGYDPSTPNEDVLGTIPQALVLMNSPQLDRAMRAERNTMLGKLIASSPNERVALENLYLKVLARRPTADEVKTFDHYLRSAPNHKEAFEDLLWALVNSTEFLNRK